MRGPWLLLIVTLIWSDARCVAYVQTFEQWCLTENSESLYFQDRCYVLYDTGLTHKAAQESCRNSGGNLAVLHTEAKHKAVLNLISTTDYCLIGFEQSPTGSEPDGNWTWTIPGVFSWKFASSGWHANQPNDYQGQDCGATQTTHFGDVPCDNINFIYPYLCEYTAVPTDKDIRAAGIYTLRSTDQRYTDLQITSLQLAARSTINLVLECGRYCLQNDACSVFSVNQSARRCSLHVTNQGQEPAKQTDVGYECWAVQWVN